MLVRLDAFSEAGLNTTAAAVFPVLPGLHFDHPEALAEKIRDSVAVTHLFAVALVARKVRDALRHLTDCDCRVTFFQDHLQTHELRTSVSMHSIGGRADPSRVSWKVPGNMRTFVSPVHAGL